MQTKNGLFLLLCGSGLAGACKRTDPFYLNFLFCKLQQFDGAFSGGISNILSSQKSGDFIYGLLRGKPVHCGEGAVAGLLLGNPVVEVSAGCNLGQVGNTDNLMIGCNLV